MAGAMSSMHNEQLRTPAGFSSSAPVQQSRTSHVEDPDAGREQSSAPEDNFEVWRLLSHIKDVPEAMLKRMPLTAILQLNAALAKESKATSRRSINDKMLMNAQQAQQSPAAIPAGMDNRRDILHAARFLGGVSMSAQGMWLQAREILGPKGVAPFGNYDMDSVGCGGCVTPKGWHELHDPSSGELRLKLFHMPNVGSSALSAKRFHLDDNESSISVGESLREIADFDSFKNALNTAREAMACALPWNRSIGAIQGYMFNSNYCQSDLYGNLRKAAILTEFVVFVFSRNALQWENKLPFLSTDDLTQVWASWKSKRAAYFVVERSEKHSSSTTSKKREKSYVCRKYNSKEGCPNKVEDCKTMYGTKLRHVCNQATQGGRMCEKNHPRKDHK